jgi:hypothetical protein
MRVYFNSLKNFLIKSISGHLLGRARANPYSFWGQIVLNIHIQWRHDIQNIVLKLAYYPAHICNGKTIEYSTVAAAEANQEALMLAGLHCRRDGNVLTVVRG